MRKNLNEKADSKRRSEKRLKDEFENEHRAETIQGRTWDTHKKETNRIKDIKDELEEEVDYRREVIEDGKGHTLRICRNDLVNSLVPIPTVSELFCAVKGELDEIKYLQKANLEALSKLNEMPPLLYVKQLKHEHDKNKLPIPSCIQVVSV